MLTYSILNPNSQAPYLIALHGGPGINGYLPPACNLLKEHYQIVLPDLPGEGGNPALDNQPFTLEDYGNEIVSFTQEFIEKKGERPCYLLGHSFGAQVAMIALAQSEHLYQAGVLVATFVNSDGWFDHITQTCKRLVKPSAQDIENTFSKSAQDDAAVKRLSFQYSPLYFPELSKDEAHKLMDKWSFTVEPYLNATQFIFGDVDMTEPLKAIGTPCLSIGYDQDLICPPQDADKIAKLICNAEVMHLKGGHFGLLTNTEAFSQAVLEFLWKIAH
jgi:pimeloyl-ACP methyl ester carboxylesterase